MKRQGTKKYYELVKGAEYGDKVMAIKKGEKLKKNHILIFKLFIRKH